MIELIIDIDKDIITTSCAFGKFITTTKKAIAALYPSNIKLKGIAKRSLSFLDITISITNNHINTELYEKPMSKQKPLHFRSNNPFNHKAAIFHSQLFRSICLNDNPKNHLRFRSKLIKRMIPRGYHPAVIRQILHSKDIPKYKFRKKYLSKMETRNLRKFYSNIIFVHCTNLFGLKFIYNSEINHIQKTILDVPDKENRNIVYFSKKYQQLFDNDNQLRKILRRFKELLPIEDEDKIELIISNRIDNKIRKYLN